MINLSLKKCKVEWPTRNLKQADLGEFNLTDSLMAAHVN